MTIDELPCTDVDSSVRERAVRRLKKRRDFHAHLLVYALVNASFVLVWFVTGRHGFFWPVFLMAFWAIGLVMNAWDVYRAEDFTEDQIRREMRKISAP